MIESDYVHEDIINNWLKSFQLEHGDARMSLFDTMTLRDLWTAIADDIPFGYEASKRLADWLRAAEITLKHDYVRRDKLSSATVDVAYVEQLQDERDELKAKAAKVGLLETINDVNPNYCPKCGKIVK